MLSPAAICTKGKLGRRTSVVRTGVRVLKMDGRQGICGDDGAMEH